MWVAFAKATHIFFSKNTCEFDMVLTRTVNVLTTNELVKLTTLSKLTGSNIFLKKKIQLHLLGKLESLLTLSGLSKCVLQFTGLSSNTKEF